MNKTKKIAVGIIAGLLIIAYGVFVLIAGIQAGKGNTKLFDFVSWYELLFLLIGGVCFACALIGKSALVAHAGGLFTGLFLFLNVARRLGGGINYAYFFGIMLVVQGLFAFLSFGLITKGKLDAIIAADFFIMGLTFIFSIMYELYWIIAIGVVFCIGASFIINAVCRNRSTEAVNEKKGYRANPNRRYGETDAPSEEEEEEYKPDPNRKYNG